MPVSQCRAVELSQPVFPAGKAHVDYRIKDAKLRLIQICLVDESGNPFVSDAQRQEMEDWDLAETKFLYEEIASHSGIAQGDIEELVKNSEKAPAVD